jgi:tetratricopeptide (TPR) repeat protein
MMRVLPAAIVALMAAVTGGPAQAQVRVAPRVLVFPFVVQIAPSSSQKAAELAWLGEAAAILVTDELERVGVPSFSRDDRVAAFDRLQLPLASGLTRAMTIRVGELAGASHIVFGEIRAGDRLAVRARLLQLDAGQQLADRAEEASAAEMFELFGRVAAGLASASGRVLSVDAKPAARPALDVFENYVKGLIGITPATQQRYLETAYNRAPRDARVLLALWSVYTEQGQHTKALAAARSVPADSPLLRRARFSAALSLIDLSRWNEAFKALVDLQAEAPSPAVVNALGVVQLRRTGAPDGQPATDFFKQAVDVVPEDTDYLFNLGYAAALARDTPAALVWLREAVRFDAADGDAHLVMSAVLASAGRTVESQRELELARLLGTRREIVPGAARDRVPAGLERLQTDMDAWMVRPSTSIANPAQREQQAVADFHVEEARRRFEAQEDREAIEALRRAIYLSPYRDEPHLLLGRLYQRAGRLPEAIDEFKVAIWCRESVEARLALAAAWLAAGDRVAARTEADRALVLAPGSQEAQALRRQID